MPLDKAKEMIGGVVKIGKNFFKVVARKKDELFLILLMGAGTVASAQTDTIKYELPGDGTLVKNGVVVDASEELDTLPYNTVWKFTKTGGSADIYTNSSDCDIKSNEACSAETVVINSKADESSPDNLARFDLEDGNYNAIFDGWTVLEDVGNPLGMLSFDVTVTPDSILYDYVTGSEVNVDHVEAQARDGESDFQTVKEEKYEKNAFGGHKHHIAIALEEFIDKTNAVPGETMYGRLKSVDHDGKTVFYKKVIFRLKNDGTIDEESIIIYPNPASDKALIKNTNEKQKIQTIEVFNTMRERVKKVQGKSLDVRDLPPGLYILRITTKNGKVITKKLVV